MTKRLIVDLPEGLHEKFSKAAFRSGLKKKFILRELVEYWTLHAELNPHYFKLLKDRRDELSD